MGLQVRHKGMSSGLGSEGATAMGDNPVPTPRGTGHEAGAALGVSGSHLFLNVNGAGVRHGGCVAGETRRHMVKEGQRRHGDMGTCTRASKQGDRGAWGCPCL